MRALIVLAAGILAAPVTGASGPRAQEPPVQFAGHGPYPAISEPAPGLPTHTLYRPRDLSGLHGAKLPIVAWANGACANDNSLFRSFLTEIASHGYLIVAIGPYLDHPSPRPAQPPEPASPGPGPGVDPTQSSQLIDAIDWAQAENTRPGSPLKGA